MGAAESLMGRLTGEQREILAIAESESADALEAYMEGKYYVQEVTEEGTDLALQWFREAVQRDPTMARAHVGVGAALMQRYWYLGGSDEDLLQAGESYSTALELDPLSNARRGLMVVHHFRGEPEEALRLGVQASRVGQRDDVETLLTRAEAYTIGGLREFAEPLYSEVLSIDPVNAEAWYWRATNSWPFEGSVATDAAEEYFRLFGDYAELHMYIAFHHHLWGNTELARQHYELALEVGESPVAPNAGGTIDAWLFAGMLFEQLEDATGARRTWQQGRELALLAEPDNSRLALVLASLRAVLGDEETVSERAADVLTLPYLDEWPLFMLAAAQEHQGRPDSALETLRAGSPLTESSFLLEAYYKMAGVPFPTTLEFEQLLADIEQEHQRNREQYGPRAEEDR